MNSYNKQALDINAKEQGFIRDNLEKVMRLVEILNYFHDSPLLSKSLVLKGGTAINLTIFELGKATQIGIKIFRISNFRPLDTF